METLDENADLPEGWMRCYSKSLQGRLYYFNTLTGESMWEHPEETEKHATTKSEQLHSRKNLDVRNEPRPKLKARSNSNSKNEIKSVKDKTIVNDKISASISSSSTGKRKAAEMKLKPIIRILKETKSPIKGKDKKDISNAKNGISKHGNLKRTLNLLSSSMDSVHNGFANKNVSSQKATKPFPSTSVKANELGTTLNGKSVPSRKIPTKNGESSIIDDGAHSLGSVNKDRRNNSDASRNAKKPELKSKKLASLRPLKKYNLSEVNGKKTGPAWNYKIPKNSKSLNDTQRKELGNCIDKSNDKEITDVEQLSNEIQFNDLSQNVKVVENLTNVRSPSWPVPDVVMTTEMERLSEPSEENVYPADELFEEDMEIDDVEFMSKTILKEIENIRVDRIEIPEMDCDYTSSREVELKDSTSLFIVLDTNILLSHLKFVHELPNSPIPGAGRPTVIIPWMVMQELDRLKSAPCSRVHEFEDDGKPGISLNILARKAIAFLHECFTENHQRVKGQTAYEAKQPMDGLVQETNDDSILHCCLLLQMKSPQAKTVLFSNDRNLCNKAIVNGVKAFDNKKLINGLRDIFQSGSITLRKDNFKEYFEAAEDQERIAERKRMADNLTNELQCILREAFAAIVEKELKEAYDELWLTVVKIKPPWTMLDTMDLLDRHWIAVFGHVVNRTLKSSILELKRMFARGDVTRRDLDSAGQMIDLGHHICDSFAAHSDYNGTLPKCLAALIVVKRTYKDYCTSANFSQNKEQYPEQLSLSAPRSDISNYSGVSESIKKVLHENSPTEEDDTTQNSPALHPHFAVMRSFDEIWKAVRVFSSSVFHSLDYPNPYQDENNTSLQRSSKEETLKFLSQFIPCLEGLVHAIQKVVACPVELSVQNSDVFFELGESIARFMKAIMCQDCNITFPELQSFCIDNHCRTALIQGLSQLDRALAVLQHCASFATNRPSIT